jgi:hypothetical protein
LGVLVGSVGEGVFVCDPRVALGCTGSVLVGWLLGWPVGWLLGSPVG